MAEIVKEDKLVNILNLTDYQTFYITEKIYESCRRWQESGMKPQEHPLFYELEPLMHALDQKTWASLIIVITDFLQEICDHDYSDKKEYMKIQTTVREDVFEEYWVCSKCGHVGDKVT